MFVVYVLLTSTPASNPTPDSIVWKFQTFIFKKKNRVSITLVLI